MPAKTLWSGRNCNDSLCILQLRECKGPLYYAFLWIAQFYADRVDDDIEGPFMFLFDLLMNEPAYGISSSFYFQFYGGDGRIGNIADQVIIVDS